MQNGPNRIQVTDEQIGYLKSHAPDCPPEEQFLLSLKATDLPDKLTKRITFWLQLPDAVSEQQAMVLKSEVLEVMLPSLMKLKVRRHKPNKTLLKSTEYLQLLNLIKGLNTFERMLARQNNPQRQKVIGVIIETFEELLHVVENSKLAQSCFHELVLGVIAQMNGAMSDACKTGIAQARQTLADAHKDIFDDLEDLHRDKLYQSLSYLESSSQNYEALLSLVDISLPVNQRRVQMASTLKIEKVSVLAMLGKYELASKYLYMHLPEIERSRHMYASTIEAVNNYLILISSLAVKQHQEVDLHQQVQFWSKKFSDWLNHKTIYTSASFSLSLNDIKELERMYGESAQKSIYPHIIETTLVYEGLSFDKDTLKVQFQPLAQSELRALRSFADKTFHLPFELTSDCLMVKNVFDLRFKMLEKWYLNHLPLFAEKVQGLHETYAKKIQLAQLKASQSHSNSAEVSSKATLEVTEQLENMSLKDAPEPCYKSDKPLSDIPPINQSTPVESKVKVKTRPRQNSSKAEDFPNAQASKERVYTANSLGLSKDYQQVTFRKLENAKGIILGFEPDFGVHNKKPEEDVMDRFRESICRFPCRVGPQNENGFKWLTPTSHKSPILMGKIKVLPWRLLPKEDMIVKGKRIIIYGDLSNTKKGKSAGHY